jgi:hypothetical protein
MRPRRSFPALVVEDAVAVAAFIGSTVFALTLMAGSVAVASLDAIVTGRRR